ncbi:MAG TPA: hypothetical protein VGM82_23010 [Gemmatimonadaceae bacterium]|jgi:hypothetical protein
MSYVCLWSPRWPTAADFPADLVVSLLAHAPRVKVGEHGLVWGDARGLNGPKLAEAMIGVATDYGFEEVRAGVARTPIAAEIAALYSRVDNTTSSGSPLVISVKPGTDASFIAPYKLHVLSPADHIAALLNGLGIETCGAFGSLDAESIEVRLGIEGVRLWQRARAEEKSFLFNIPQRALPSAAVEWVEYGLKDLERLQFIINSLAGTVCTALVARGERAREMGLVFSLGNRTQRTHTIRSSRPSAEQKRWMRLAREALDTITLPDAVMGVTLRAESVVGSHGAQGDLFDRGFASAPAVEDAIILLTDDQGDVVVEPVNSAHPLLEQRTLWKGVAAGGWEMGAKERRRISRAGQRVAEPSPANDDDSANEEHHDPNEPGEDVPPEVSSPQWKRLEPTIYRPTPSSNRPTANAQGALTLQLLPSPKVVTVDVESRRDHEVPTRYLDGNEWHNILEAAGPDRVTGGKWNAEFSREYFRCVREDGMMVWLYRGMRSQTQDWFLHGWWD